MARREYFHSPQCVHKGCTERAPYVFSRRADYDAEVKRLNKTGGWRCVRHTRPDEVLSADAPQRETVLESYETDFGYGGKVHRFFAAPGATKGGNGFVHGPGFKAYAEDFPTGTRIVVAARVEVPTGGDRS